MTPRKSGRPPKANPGNAIKRAQPPDIHERIEWKAREVNDFVLKAMAYPNDPCYPLAVARVKEELEQLKALRDGRTWRRNG